MTTRLDCNVLDTKELLGNILTQVIGGRRCMFLCEPGQGAPTIQRARVMLSRVRKARRNKGKKMRHFQLHNTIHPHTEDGKRFDAVVVWEVVNPRHSMLESLEDLIGSGEAL